MSLAQASTLRGVITISALTVNVIVWFVPILIIAFGKLVLPLGGWRRITSLWLTAMGENWTSCNNVILRATQSISWDVRGVESLQRREWYLVLSNHRSWVDILILQAVFNRRIPFLKFFIKQQLIWVPFLGLAWWAMDMPFMKRYTREELDRCPALRGRDLEATRRACERFRDNPTSVIVFVEGTRFTAAKLEASGAPYRHVLPPRPGGTAFVLAAMGDILRSILDVSILYTGEACSLWDLCCGRVRRISIDVRQRPIEPWMTQGDYSGDAEHRERFKAWLTAVWHEKDDLIAKLLAADDRGPG